LTCPIDQSWESNLVRLHQEGISQRKIAMTLQIPKSKIQRALTAIKAGREIGKQGRPSELTHQEQQQLSSAKLQIHWTWTNSGLYTGEYFKLFFHPIYFDVHEQVFSISSLQLGWNNGGSYNKTCESVRSNWSKIWNQTKIEGGSPHYNLINDCGRWKSSQAIIYPSIKVM